MSQKAYKPRIPDLFEAGFSFCYLVFAYIAGIIFLIKGKGETLPLLYGILTLTLAGGDSFHLLPRILKALKGSNDRIKKALGLGNQITSITMTIFYIILLYVWKNTFPELKAPMILEIIIWITAIIRIVICLFPQNNWISGEGNPKLSAIRNAVFTATGIAVIALYAFSGNAHDYHMTRMAAAIIISFACYLPVTIYSKKKPMIGMLMMPKTLAYIWMIIMGLTLCF